MTDQNNPYQRIRSLYVAGPVDEPAQAATARKYIARLWELVGGARYVVFCPFMNGFQLGVDCLLTPEEIDERHLALLDSMDALFLLPNWQTSKHAGQARQRMQDLGRPAFQGLKEAREALDRWPDSEADKANNVPSGPEQQGMVVLGMRPDQAERVQELIRDGKIPA